MGGRKIGRTQNWADARPAPTFTFFIFQFCGFAVRKQGGRKRIAAADDTPGEWLTHGRTYGEQRFSPLTQISTSTVKDLGLAWSFDLPENRGIEATPLLIRGPTADTILGEAEKLGVDLIVMATHGRGAVFDILVGSVSQAVLRRSPIPVLMVPARS